jgi:hypothetical protein
MIERNRTRSVVKALYVGCEGQVRIVATCLVVACLVRIP